MMKSLRCKLKDRFGSLPIVFRILLIMAWLCVPTAFSQNLFAQQAKVSGKVLSFKDKTPVPGASVLVKGTSVGCITDFDGKFTLDVPAGNDVLIISFTGMKKVEAPVIRNQEMVVELEEMYNDLNEIVVVGYGVQKKSLVTGAISSLKAEEISKSSISRTSEALQGRTSGVSVIASSGAPGSGINVRVRGLGSNGKADPLYIVDGMKTDNINNVEPGDIQSIEVLKDAASSAIYGTEGANGVVIVTTKGGKAGSSEITYNFQYGIQTAPKMPEMMNAEEYSIYLTEAGVAGNIPDPAKYKGVKGTNWLDETFQSAPMQKHHVTMSGANEKFSYMASGSYLNQDGIVGGDKSKFERYTLRLNATHKAKEWLELGSNLSYSNTKRNSILEDSEYGSVIGSALALDPMMPVVFNGQLPTFAQNALNEGYTLIKNSDGKYYGISEFVGAEMGNPLAMLEVQKTKAKDDVFLGTFNAKFTPFKGFSFTSRVSIDYSSGTTHQWYPKYYWSSERSNTKLGKELNFWKNRRLMFENFASYNLEISNHNLTVLAGMSAEESQWSYVNSSSEGMFKEGDEFAYHGSNNIDGKVAGNVGKSRMTSYFGRLSYNYSGKYMFESTLRRDGSSMFAPEYSFAVFPSVSLGWVVSEEAFWSKSVVNFLKLRTSWGENGSISNIEADQWKSMITSDGIKYPKPGGGFYTGAEIDVMSNPSLKWETSQQTDIGFEALFLNERLSLSADYYIKKTKDLLTPGQGPLSAGNKFPFVNGGDVTNKGIEIDLGWKHKIDDFNYGFNLNFATLSNEVTRLAGNSRIDGVHVGTTGYVATWFEKGHPIWYFRGYKTKGIFQSTDAVTKYMADNKITEYAPKPLAGDPIISDENHDGKINEDDMTEIGSPHPDYILGASFNCQYKGFDFSMLLQSAIGNDVMMGFFRTDRGTFNKPRFFYTDRWTESNKTNSWFRAETSSAFIYNSDLMIEDASYLRVKQIQLGYTLPKQLTSKLKIRSLRCFVSLEDFFTFTKYRGIDPEAGSATGNSIGIDRGLYPIPRKLMTGLSFSF
jgi:TonB-dependent starch-binding outer membrane protein SusC